MPNNHDGQTVDAVAFINQLDGEPFDIRDRVFIVKTRNSEYLVDNRLSSTIMKGDGPAKHGRVQGATFGGSMIMPDKLLIGAHMEFNLIGDYNTYATSPIESIKVIK